MRAGKCPRSTLYGFRTSVRFAAAFRNDGGSRKTVIPETRSENPHPTVFPETNGRRPGVVLDPFGAGAALGVSHAAREQVSGNQAALMLTRWANVPVRCEDLCGYHVRLGACRRQSVAVLRDKYPPPLLRQSDESSVRKLQEKRSRARRVARAAGVRYSWLAPYSATRSVSRPSSWQTEPSSHSTTANSVPRTPMRATGVSTL